jgi:ABC-type transport system involved in cytochrome c biogenesis permease component
MNKRLYMLFRKEYFLKLRQANTISGIFLFSILFCTLLAFLLRQLSVRAEELGLIALPAFWIIFLSTIFRYSLHSYHEETRTEIFSNQIRSGFSPGELFYVKLCCDFLVASLLLYVQFLVFYMLLGIPDADLHLLRSSTVFLLSLPGVLSITSLGACMSLRTGREEILMPVMVLPLLLLISVSVLSYSEGIFDGTATIFDSFWIRVVCGISLIMTSVSGVLFNLIVSIRE